jgi:hypothetical protein
MAGERTHVFISYAAEDVVFATWLSRKLASVGYAVWFDRLRMLGGEPWPQTIDEAIKSKSFRVLGLLSKHSISKPNPVKERTMALEVGKRQGISDFLVTLRLDETLLDWQTVDISYISFNPSWAQGFRDLLDKLDSIRAPRPLADGAERAALTFPRGDDLIRNAPEQLVTNVLRVEGVPNTLQGYEQTRNLGETEIANLSEVWTHHRTASGDLLALFPPPQSVRDIVRTPQSVDWLLTDRRAGFDPRTVAANLVIETIRKRLRGGGFRTHPAQTDIVYLPDDFSSDGKLRFVGHTGRATWLKIRGKATFIQAGHPRETNYHHFAVQMRLARGIDRAIWLQVRPTLFFFDEAGTPITDKRVGPRRRRLTKSWWNNKWLNRLLAAEKIFSQLPPTAHEPLSIAGGFRRLESNLGVDEAALEVIGDDSDESDSATDTPLLIEPDDRQEDESDGE